MGNNRDVYRTLHFTRRYVYQYLAEDLQRNQFSCRLCRVSAALLLISFTLSFKFFMIRLQASYCSHFVFLSNYIMWCV